MREFKKRKLNEAKDIELTKSRAFYSGRNMEQCAEDAERLYEYGYTLWNNLKSLYRDAYKNSLDSKTLASLIDNFGYYVSSLQYIAKEAKKASRHS